MHFIKSFFAISGLILLSACSGDDPEPECFQEEQRRIVATIKAASGTILGSQCDDNTYTILPDKHIHSGPLGQFEPCNLPVPFQENGIRIIFTGYVYESFENEDICADFFEITELREIDQEP